LHDGISSAIATSLSLFASQTVLALVVRGQLNKQAAAELGFRLGGARTSA